jgi:hypothetical protein
MFAMESNSQRPRRNNAPAVRRSITALRLAIGVLLLPLLAFAQGNSTMDVEIAPGVWGPCGSLTVPGSVDSPLLTPLTPAAGSPVMFRLRKTSIATPSESVEIPTLQFAPPDSDVFAPRSITEIQFSSVPSLPFAHDAGGTQVFDMAMIPPEAGTYRFGFRSRLWDGGSCTVDITVAQELDCLIESIDGINGGSPQDGVLDFGALPVGQVAAGTIRFNFFDMLPVGEGIRASTFLDPPFEFDEGSYTVAPARDQATLDIIFAPVESGSFSQTVEFFTDREEEKPECRLEFEFRGEGVAPELSLTFGTPVCGDNLEIPFVLRNESTVAMQNLDLNVSSGYNLIADPPGSFNVNNFSLGAAGSSNPPAERRVVLRLVQAQPGEAAFVTLEQAGELLVRGPIPAASCIRILEPADLTLDFGDVPVNTAAPPQTIRVANQGNTLATVIASVRNGGLSAGFGVGSGAAANVTLSIPPTSQELLNVTFLPPSIGAKQSVVDFTNAAFPNIPSVSLSGAGVDQPRPILSFRAAGNPVSLGATIRFPATGLGQDSSVPLVITNDGSLPALGLSVTAPGGEFTASGSAPAQLATGQSANFTLTFGPNQTGTRRGPLTVRGENLDPIVFTLEGDGVMAEVTVNGVGLNVNVPPAQTNPLPTIGLELAGGVASQTLEGDLILEFTPDLPQTPPAGFIEAYQAVGFMAGTGAGGRTIRFRFEQGQQRAIFPAEQAAQLARFQSGTVAGSLRFRLANVRTLQGADVPIVNPIVGSATVARLAPAIRSMTTPQITGGINVVVQAFSTTREITGVCLALTAAAGADLSFSRPDPTFLNAPFSQWFNGSGSFPHGGSFSLTIPIDISDMRAFGSAQLWLRNSEGWSSPNSPCP